MFLVKWLVKVLFGTLAALLMSMLFACGILPGFSRLAIFPEIPFSIWGLTTGLLVTLLLFCFWRPKQEVFFDRICINPEDQKLKSDAIFSLAGILKASKDAGLLDPTITRGENMSPVFCSLSQTEKVVIKDSKFGDQEMLVLWDQSWSSRLWCLFELAAFLKSTVDSDGKPGGRLLCLSGGSSSFFFLLKLFLMTKLGGGHSLQLVGLAREVSESYQTDLSFNPAFSD